MKCLKIITILYYFIQLTSASLDTNQNFTLYEDGPDPHLGDILKSGQEIIKLRLQIVDFNMEKQNQTLMEINHRMLILEENFTKLFKIIEGQQNSRSLLTGEGYESMTEDAINWESGNVTLRTTNIDEIVAPKKKNANATERIFMTELHEKEEPKLCKLKANDKLSCTELALPATCKDSNEFNCIQNKCRIKNAIYGDKSFWATCDGDWTIIQRRINGSVNFRRNWQEYKQGFGEFEGEFWLGLDKIHSITNVSGPVQLHIRMQDVDNVWKYAQYETFSIGNEAALYKLNPPGTYSGNAGNSFDIHRGEAFSTYDKDNDKKSDKNCADYLQGGWWYYHCDLSENESNLNGVYYKGGVIVPDKPGIYWKEFRGTAQSLQFVEMKIRPKS
ncbi:fibrinogen-like protein 1 [Stomoxys calcitrans]|uniref:Fibrinogen C-terminal domain-containing protein n=1 Tax=Stomoxys calcitrans TaxID=35570 RepID=A0A1I8QA50_STOCA|nr:fibrinogen-like protein 1 [Stomoxys calcitrans]